MEVLLLNEQPCDKSKTEEYKNDFHERCKVPPGNLLFIVLILLVEALEQVDHLEEGERESAHRKQVIIKSLPDLNESFKTALDQIPGSLEVLSSHTFQKDIVLEVEASFDCFKKLMFRLVLSITYKVKHVRAELRPAETLVDPELIPGQVEFFLIPGADKLDGQLHSAFEDEQSDHKPYEVVQPGKMEQGGDQSGGDAGRYNYMVAGIHRLSDQSHTVAA